MSKCHHCLVPTFLAGVQGLGLYRNVLVRSSEYVVVFLFELGTFSGGWIDRASCELWSSYHTVSMVKMRF